MAYIKKKMPRDVRRLRNRLNRFEYLVENYDIEYHELYRGGRKHIDEVEETINQYNEVLREADELRDKIDAQVRIARDIHERLRMIVVSAFGKDSIEYEQLGGVRQSDIDYSRKDTGDAEEA